MDRLEMKALPVSKRGNGACANWTGVIQRIIKVLYLLSSTVGPGPSLAKEGALLCPRNETAKTGPLCPRGKN